MSRPISNKLRFMLEEINQAFGHAEEVVVAAYNQAIQEGFSPSEAKDLIFENVKSISKRTIYYYLPDQCKDKHMQEVALHKRPLQICTADDRVGSTSLSHKVSALSSDTDVFMKDLKAELDSRELTAEVYRESKILDTKDKIIGEKEKLIKELRKKNELISNYDGDWLILPSEHSEYIYKIHSQNIKNGITSQFSLAHDGIRITRVEDLSLPT